MKRNEDGTVRVSKVLITVLAIPAILNIIFVGLYCLGTAVQIFKASIPVGLVLTLIGLGPAILASPIYSFFMLGGLFEEIVTVKNNWEFWLKAVLLYVGLYVVPWIVYVISGTILISVANWLIRVF